jgi:hypothetical protein
MQMCSSLFSRYIIVSGFINGVSDCCNIPSSLVCLICFPMFALAEYGTGLDKPIIGVLSVMLNLYSYTSCFAGLVVKNFL